MATVEAHEQRNQERRRKVTQRLRKSKMEWESRVKAELKYQRFRQEPRPNEDRSLVVAAIVSIGALVLDWWVRVQRWNRLLFNLASHHGY